MNNMFMVGSSILITANASGFSKSEMVSPISNPSIPTTAQISPLCTSSTFTLPNPTNVYSSLILDLTILPSFFIKETGMFSLIVPRATRPIAILPTKEE